VSPVIKTVAAEEGHSAGEQKSRVNMTSSIFTEDRYLRRLAALSAREDHSENEQKNIIRGDIRSKNWRLCRTGSTLFVRAATALLRPCSLKFGGVAIYDNEDRRILSNLSQIFFIKAQILHQSK
jgi:hypothetical protein